MFYHQLSSSCYCEALMLGCSGFLASRHLILMGGLSRFFYCRFPQTEPIDVTEFCPANELSPRQTVRLGCWEIWRSGGLEACRSGGLEIFRSRGLDICKSVGREVWNLSLGDELDVIPAMTCDHRHGSKGFGSHPDKGPPILKSARACRSGGLEIFRSRGLDICKSVGREVWNLSLGDELDVIPAMTCDHRHGSKGFGSHPDKGPPILKSARRTKQHAPNPDLHLQLGRITRGLMPSSEMHPEEKTASKSPTSTRLSLFELCDNPRRASRSRYSRDSPQDKSPASSGSVVSTAKPLYKYQGEWIYLVTHAMPLFDLQDVYMVIGSLATLDLPMTLSVIPRGSWDDVARRFTMIRWVSPKMWFRNHKCCEPTVSCIPEPLRVTQILVSQFPSVRSDRRSDYDEATTMDLKPMYTWA
ncbi:gibberellin 2-beta-dioxygenase 1-like [Dorcoceras hygrometricum]|uniref:Gibberellin 2-beta-dioxygenase 1-like n=1 Tax=Dorcoceras hygrometricum TaxID=472368 RepID=A0A2Z7D3M2_9LAMI|nr:gibberellin 2-beta-dioxygenase 1-like [Dorcoceras hygrometricum]